MTAKMHAAASMGPLPELLRHHQPRLRAICRRMCGPDDDADDVLQDTYVEIVRHLAGFRGDSSFMTWATAVVRSQLHRHRRRHRRHALRDDAIDSASHSYPTLFGRSEREPELQACADSLRASLLAALDELAELDREVFVLRELEGMTAPEVANTLGLSVPAVKSRLHRARRSLRANLDGDPRVIELR
jgi:RNA polymerase sigma-70 factor (ECF subfamily)